MARLEPSRLSESATGGDHCCEVNCSTSSPVSTEYRRRVGRCSCGWLPSNTLRSSGEKVMDDQMRAFRLLGLNFQTGCCACTSHSMATCPAQVANRLPSWESSASVIASQVESNRAFCLPLSASTRYSSFLA